MSQAVQYTTQLQAGLGLLDETKSLLGTWEPGMSAQRLYQQALASGDFPNVAARRLQNIVTECFAPRYLVNDGRPAHLLQRLVRVLSSAEFNQLLFIYTCRANAVLADFVRQVYWGRYAGGYQQITSDDARQFIERAINDGKTQKRWAESTVRRVSAYVMGAAADYGLLEPGLRSNRQLLPFRVLPTTVVYLAHELHFAGVGDNALLAHEDWGLFGLSRDDVLDEIKRQSLKGYFIVQSAGDVVRIGWKHQSMEALCDVLAQERL